MKKKCFSKKTISTYYYGEIEDREKFNSIEKHISMCDKCKKYYKSLQTLSSKVPKCKLEHDKELNNNIISLDNYKKKNKKFHYLLAVASVICLFVIIFSIYRINQNNNTDLVDNITDLILEISNINYEQDLINF